MNKLSKTLLLVLCAVLLVTASVMGTLAYLTSSTDPVINTFTMGKVDIELTEPSWDALNKEEDGSLKIFPGVTYAKDPTITVAEGSEDCYLIATVTIEKRSETERRITITGGNVYDLSL